MARPCSREQFLDVADHSAHWVSVRAARVEPLREQYRLAAVRDERNRVLLPVVHEASVLGRHVVLSPADHVSVEVGAEVSLEPRGFLSAALWLLARRRGD